LVQLSTEGFNPLIEIDSLGEDLGVIAVDFAAAVPSPKPSFTRQQAGAQIVRDNIRWTADFDGVTRVSYAFRSTFNGESPLAFSRFDEAQIGATTAALQSWSDVANIVFTRVGNGTTGDNAYADNATMLFANYNSGKSDGGAAYAYYPGSRSDGSNAGDLWVNQFATSSNTLGYLSYGNMVLTHEIGHAIGLNHPGEYNAAVGVSLTYAANAEYVEDTRQYTIMSYFSASNTGATVLGYAAAPLVDDIVAAQLLYGANMATRTGDTTYGFNSTADRDWFSCTSAEGTVRWVIFAVWDAGGIDTFDFSGYGAAQNINLQQGAFSDIGGAVGNVAVAVNTNIENAIGGGGDDRLTGNGLNNRLTGNAGNDTLWGGAGDDSLSGGSGSDTASYVGASAAVSVSLGLITAQNTGGAGTDTLTSIENLLGSSFNDTLTGTSGANSLDGGAGDDILVGGAGDDIYGVDSVGDSVTELANEGVDTVRSSISYRLADDLENLTLLGTGAISGYGNGANNSLIGNGAANILDGGAGADSMTGGGGNDTYIVDSEGDTVTELANGGIDSVYSSLSFSLGANVENLVLNGAAAINGTGNGDANILIGNSADNRLLGGDNNDILVGGAGNDYLDGGSGNDTVSFEGTTTSLSIDLSTALGTITTSLGTDTLVSIEGIIGGSGNDVLKGDAGANYLDGGLGNDTITGGAGDDIYGVDSTLDIVTELAGGGTDEVRASISYTLGSTLENLTLVGFDAINGTGNSLDNVITGNSGNNLLIGGAGNDTLNGGSGLDIASYADVTTNLTLNLTLTTAQSMGSAGNDTLISIEGLIGGSGNDSLTGNGDNNIFEGGAGNDRLDGGAGLDVASFAGLTAGVEVDLSAFSGTISTALGTDTLISIEGLVGGSGNDVLKAGATATYLDGGAGNDFLGGSAYADTLIGGSGNDGLAGGAGNDSLNGGDGDDTLLGQAGDDTIGGGIGRDFMDGGDGTDTINAGDANDLINGGNGNDIINGDAGNDSIYGDAGNDVIDGGAGDDDLSGGNDNDTITGGIGDDRIAGGYGNDILNGGDGNDTISANDGDDTITGGLGVDNLYGFTGNDTIDGGDSNDTLLGMEGDDTVRGGTGADYIVGGDGTDTLYGDDGDDNMQGGDGNDTLNGGLGNDGLDGGAGNDTLNGEAGNDYLGGGEGNDTLSGGDGNDVFVGGAGKDTLTGGAGADAFFFTALSDSTSAAIDMITDFSWADGDYIDLSRIDANNGQAGDQAFSFVNSFTKQAGQATLTYDAASNISLFSADVDGDGVADFVLQITGQQHTSQGWVL
jgi:serralysin